MNKKEDIYKLLTRLSLEQKDIYLLSLSGDNAFIQPYKGDAQNALIEETA